MPFVQPTSKTPMSVSWGHRSVSTFRGQELFAIVVEFGVFRVDTHKKTVKRRALQSLALEYTSRPGIYKAAAGQCDVFSAATA